MKQKTGRIEWIASSIKLANIVKHPVPEVSKMLRDALPVIVWNAAALEGNPCTQADVEEILNGVEPAHVASFDVDQVRALANGYELVLEAVDAGSFELSKAFSDRVHAVVAKHEAIESGHFRGEGSVNGGGAVRLAAGGVVEGDPTGDNGAQLRTDFDTLLKDLEQIENPRGKALAYIASATRSQFYFDGNKRTSRIMGTGLLLASGYPPLCVPKARQDEYNEALDELFRTDEATSFISFLESCFWQLQSTPQ